MKSQTNLSPEQVKENSRASKYAWYQKHKDYFQNKIVCECGRTITRHILKDHLRTKIHAKIMNSHEKNSSPS